MNVYDAAVKRLDDLNRMFEEYYFNSLKSGGFQASEWWTSDTYKPEKDDE